LPETDPARVPDPESDPTSSGATGVPSDAELADLEAELELAGAPDTPGGAALEAFGDPRPSAATPARPSFRASLRASFVSGRFEGDGAAPAVVARALDAAVVPVPSTEFRSALRARFLAARTDEPPVAAVSLFRSGAAPGAPGSPAASGARFVPGQGVAPRAGARDRGTAVEASSPRARSWPRLGVAAALAAVLLAALLLRGQLGWLAERGGAVDTPRWTLFGAGELAGLLVDGAPVTDPEGLAARLGVGATFETGAHGLRLAVGREIVIDLGPGTRARVPAYSAVAGLTFELERGALRVATGTDFQPPGGGRRLVIVTPHLEALAVGTLFGVDCTPEYSCVCCFEGEALTRSLLAGGTEGRVAAGRTRLVHADGRVRDLDLVSHHRAPLVDLHEAWRT
jgi:hypothetical protein